MILVELTHEMPWPDSTDWDRLAVRAARAAIERTPHGELLTTPATVEISVRLTSDDEVHALTSPHPEWLRRYWIDHPLPLPSGLKADKRFYDSLNDE